MISTLEQIKSRLNLIERWNVSYIYDRLQKLQTDFNQIKKNTPFTEVWLQSISSFSVKIVDLDGDEWW